VLCRRTADRPGRSLILGIVAVGCLCATVAGAAVYRLRAEHLGGEPAVSMPPHPGAVDPVDSHPEAVSPPMAAVPVAAPPSRFRDPMQDEQSRRLRALAAGRAAADADAPALDVPPVAADPAPAAAAEGAYETRRASGRLPDVHVVVYTTSWCPVCKRAKQWMNAHGVAYEEHDVEASSESARQMRAINPRGGVPTFDVEGQVEVGFSAGDLTATMQRAAVRRAM
jgi:glutaredoxin